MLNSVAILYELFFIYVSAEEISRDIIIYMLQLKKICSPLKFDKQIWNN